MSRQSTITQKDVDALCQRLLEAGKTPTIRLLIAEHGSGSQGTVQPLLKEWRRKREEANPRAPETPLSDALLTSLTKAFHHDVNVARAELKDQLEQSEEANSDLARENTTLQAQLSQAEAELAALSEQDAVIRGHASQLEQELQQLRSQLEIERAGRLEAERAAAAAEVQRVAADLRTKDLHHRYDALAQESANKEARLLEDLTSKRIAVEACNARLEAAARSQEAMKQELNELRKSERVAVESAAELRGQLQALQTGR